MILLTRLNGPRFALNADLIERVEATPDTVVTLSDGTRYIVTDTVEHVVSAVRAFRSEALAGAIELCAAWVNAGSAPPPYHALRAVADVPPSSVPPADDGGQESEVERPLRLVGTPLPEQPEDRRWTR